MKITYTVHAEEKLAETESRNLAITKQKIDKVVRKPEVIDREEEPVLIAIGKLTNELSLCVAYRKIDSGIRIITFYPAERGRYERKILQRR